MSDKLDHLNHALSVMEDQRDELAARLAQIETANEEQVPWSLVQRLSSGSNPLTEWRKYRNFSIEELSMKSGVGKEIIIKAEKSWREIDITLTDASRIAAALRIDIADLIPCRRDIADSLHSSLL